MGGGGSVAGDHIGADRLPAAVVIDAGCEVIVTTDRAFDGLGDNRRVDPLDTDAVNALVGGRFSANL